MNGRVTPSVRSPRGRRAPTTTGWAPCRRPYKRRLGWERHDAGTTVVTMTQSSRERPDRNLAMELVRATESACLAAARWVGRGEKEQADGAAVEAMRMSLSTVQMTGTVIIGEGEKDDAPMLFNGEEVGDGSEPHVDVAVDPIDGTTLTAHGKTNALSVIAVADRGLDARPRPLVLHGEDRRRPRFGRGDRHHGEPVTEPALDREVEGRGRARPHRGHPRPSAPRRSDRRSTRGGLSHPVDHRRRRVRLGRHLLARRRRRRALRHRRHAGRRDLGGSAQGDGRRDAGAVRATERRRAQMR